MESAPAEQPIAEGDSQTVAEVDSAPVEQSTEPTTQETVEDSFFDPNSVPEELKPAYKQMQADYTRKMQALAEERKQAEEWKTKADEYAKYQEYIPVIEEMLQGKQEQKESPEVEALASQLREAGYSDDAIDMMRMTAGFLTKQFNQQRETEKAQLAATQKAEWVNSQIDEALKVDPRLTEDGEFSGLVERIVAADPNWKDNPVEATKKAVAQVDALLSRAKSEGKEELSNSAKAKASKFPTVKSSPQSTSGVDRVMTVHEAAEEAKKELGL